MVNGFVGKMDRPQVTTILMPPAVLRSAIHIHALHSPGVSFWYAFELVESLLDFGNKELARSSTAMNDL